MSDKPKTDDRKIISRVELLILLGLAVVFSIDVILVIRDYLTRDSWIETNATIVYINSKTHWLAYQYTVDGQQYIGTRLSFTEDSLSELGNGRREQFPEGMNLTIYYDPSDPSRAVITPIANFGRIILILVAIALVPFGYFIIKSLFYRYLHFVSDMLTGDMWKNREPKDV